jgi:hypothetical protein
MSQFTLLLSRLVDLLGAETAAQVVREFAGQTLQFPITDHYDTDRNDFGFPVLVQVIGQSHKPRQHSPLTEAEAIEISHRLLATVRKCCAPFQTKTLPAAESPVMDASCTTHPNQCTAPLHIPAAVPPSSEQEPHTPLAAQPESLSFPQSIDRS